MATRIREKAKFRKENADKRQNGRERARLKKLNYNILAADTAEREHPGSRRHTDIGADDYVYRLRQGEKSAVDKADYHNGRGR